MKNYFEGTISQQSYFTIIWGLNYYLRPQNNFSVVFLFFHWQIPSKWSNILAREKNSSRGSGRKRASFKMLDFALNWAQKRLKNTPTQKRSC